MGFAFNPFTGNFDVKGAGGGGGSAFFAGEVATYADLPLDGTAALDSRWLVRSNSGTWPFSSYKQAGVYVRIATVGSSRDNDYRLTDTSFHDVMSDAAFVIYDDGDATKNLKFQLSGITTATTRTLTVPNASGTIALTSQLADTRIYTSNDTWTKPTGAKLVHYLLIGGGGGGGAGRRSASTNSLGGGGGGAGGGITAGFVDPAFLSSTESITVGAGGTGAVDSADNTNGAGGTAGGESSFGSFIKAKGGAAGGGGSSSAGSAGAATTLSSIYYGTNASTAAGASGGGTTGATAVASVYLPTGGGGGGARGGSVNYLGGKGGDIGQTNTGITSAPAVAAGTSGPAGIRSQSSWAGTGGGGGSMMSSDNGVLTGFVGGAGGTYGGGGGGGSGAGNAAGGSSAGGTGGAGVVIVTTYF